MTNKQVTALRREAWAAYTAGEAGKKDEISLNGLSVLTVGSKKMRLSVFKEGEMPAGGYPLFICLHGGGSDPTGEMNDSQWQIMQKRCMDGTPGIYAATRAVRDTWDCHSVSEAYPFYDEIIRRAILFWNVNPDRVYFTGYSAGGDGVYQIAPRMADRLAAANMSAGHPNQISLINLFNLPFFLQVGELDGAYDRNRMTPRYSAYLDRLGMAGGYPHFCYIHTGKPHSACRDVRTDGEIVIADPAAWLKSAVEETAYEGGTVMVNTNCVTRMGVWTRNPLPDRICWDSTVRAPSRGIDSFYWLALPQNCADGYVEAKRQGNVLRIPVCTLRNTQLTILLNEEMIDFDVPLSVELAGKVYRIQPTISEALLETTTHTLGDPRLQFAASVTVEL